MFHIVYSNDSTIQKVLGGSRLDSLAPLHRDPGVSLGQMVSELLQQNVKELVNTYLHLTCKCCVLVFAVFLLTW